MVREMTMRNIKDYGAVGDGATLETAAIQRAVDDGGMVYIPEGTYRTGTIYLRSNGGLHLAPGATLIASHNREDYNTDNFCAQNRVFTSEFVTGAHLITAVEQKNIIIEGHGTIDGEGNYWMNENHLNSYNDYEPNPARPAQMIFFCECKNVHVTDVNIINSPYWHLFFHGCEDVFVRGLTIRGDRPRWTNDGIDIDCCKRVTVSDCVIDVGDDAITLRAHKEPLLHSDGICENVTVTNCVIRAHNDYGIRIGVGAGIIRNCTISNMIIDAPQYGGIGIMCCWNSTSRLATSIENILVTGCHVRSRHPLRVLVAWSEGHLPMDCYLKNIHMTDLMLIQESNSSSTDYSEFRGTEDHLLQNISVENCIILLPENTADRDDWFLVRHVTGLSFHNLRVAGMKRNAFKNVISTSGIYNMEVDGVEYSS